MSGKAKTWAQLIADINETGRKWERKITITNALPPRKRNSATWQNDEDRAVTATFSHWSARSNNGDVKLVVKREITAIANLRLIAIALETVRLTEVREVTRLIIIIYNQIYPQEPTAAPPPPPRPEPTKIPSHYALLHVSPSAPLAVCEAAYRALARSNHPDQGGSTETMQRLNSAIELIRKEKA